MKTFLNDVKFTLRFLKSNPIFAAAAIITVALGLSSNAIIFSAVRSVFLKPLPYREADRLAWIFRNNAFLGYTHRLATFTRIDEWRRNNQCFEQMAILKAKDFNLLSEQKPERLYGLRVSANLLKTLGVNVAIGRDFLSEEEVFGNHLVAILSHEIWQRRFGGDPAVLGKRIVHEQNSYVVIGVLPAGFRFPFGNVPNMPSFSNQSADILEPLGITPDEKEGGGGPCFAIGRLKPQFTARQAQSDIQNISNALDEKASLTAKRWTEEVAGFEQIAFGKIRPVLVTLFAVVVFVQIIVCGNISSLLLARVVVRRKELSIRASLGAPPWRMIRQMMTECLVLALLGGVAGVLITFLLLPLFRIVLPPEIALVTASRLDGGVFVFTFALAVMTGFLFGMAPALQILKISPAHFIQEAGRTASAGKATLRIQGALAAAVVAFSFILLTGSGLMVKTLNRMTSVDPGFDMERLLVVNFALSPSKYKNEQIDLFIRDLLNRIDSLPGVESSAATYNLPINGGIFAARPVMIEGRPQEKEEDKVWARFRLVSPKYFQTMGIHLIAGRSFDADEIGPNRPVTVVVNQAFVRKFLPNQEPVGTRLNYGPIIGVVKDTLETGLDSEPEPQVYLPGLGFGDTAILIRTHDNPTAIKNAVEREIASLDKEIPIRGAQSMERILSASLAQRSFQTAGVSLFALIALVLSLGGVYALINYSVSQRMPEFSVRTALGANRRNLLSLVLSQALWLVLIGEIAGCALMLGGIRLLSSRIFGLASPDPIVFLFISFSLIAATLLAAYFPAIRAARANPAAMLRS